MCIRDRSWLHAENQNQCEPGHIQSCLLYTSVSVKADNERGTVFDHVKIRVDDSFTLEMHIDTDEANASKIATGDTVKII